MITDYEGMVREFTHAFMLPINDYWESLRATDDLLYKLIAEELDELHVALNEDDKVGIADALGDLLYVVLGAAIRWDLPIGEVFTEIHRSNMSKLQADGTVLKRDDGKVLKPKTYSPPDIETILEKYENEPTAF